MLSFSIRPSVAQAATAELNAAASTFAPVKQVQLAVPNIPHALAVENTPHGMMVPPETNQAEVRHVGGDVMPPVVIYQVEPEFSETARTAKFTGIVLVGLVVDQHGMPTNIHVVDGLGMGLDEKAVEAVRRYRFKPATEDGVAVSVDLNVEVNFQIF